MKINKKQFNKWLNALYAEKYNKGTSRLQIKDTYCCLGVGCVELIPPTLLKMDGNVLAGSYPGMYQDAAPQWLKDIDTHFYDKTGTRLSMLNDNGAMAIEHMGNFSHPEIAMLLDLVYNYKILDK